MAEVKKNTNIVRVVLTYRVPSKSVQEAMSIIKNHLESEQLPKGIKLIGKADTMGLRGLL